MILEDLQNKKAKLAVIGLGYVGLPIALKFAKKISVVGFDINESRVEMMRNNIDPSNELAKEEFDNADIHFTNKLEDLKEVGFFVVAVPTPIDESNNPDLTPLKKATETVAKVLKKGDYVVFESTVYPGCTEEDCIPILEEISGLAFNVDFKVGYSPERINPGDLVHTLENVVKVVSGSCDVSLDQIAKTYELVVKAGVHRAPSIKVAEAAKIIENTQRDVNIALINELSIIFNRMSINTYDVLKAAGTKWNFLNFSPGLVGGHCIGVDPYYLTFKSAQVGYHARIITAGRSLNDTMGFYVAKQTVKKMIALGKNMNDVRVLILGATFKEDVSDIRNSKVVDIIKELNSFSCDSDITDPHANPEEFLHEYGTELVEPTGKYDAIILAVNHKEYINKEASYFENYLTEDGVFVDLKGVMKDKVKCKTYWSL